MNSTVQTVAAEVGESHAEIVGNLESLTDIAGDHYIGARSRSREHDLCAGRWTRTSRWLSASSAVLSAVGGASLIAEGRFALLGGSLSLVASILATISTSLSASEQVASHKKARDDFARLATSITFFNRVKLKTSRSYFDLENEYVRLLEVRDQVTSEAPRIPAWAAKKAEKAARQKVEKRRRDPDVPVESGGNPVKSPVDRGADGRTDTDPGRDRALKTPNS